jgi:hypothetical protein
LARSVRRSYDMDVMGTVGAWLAERDTQSA